MAPGKMHQTTVRFGSDLWEDLEVECGRLGVSVAQYLREAALARLSYTAGRRGDPRYESALAGVGATLGLGDSRGERKHRADEAALAAYERQLDSSAVGAQSRQARERSQKLREDAERLRRPSASGRRDR